MGPKCFVRRRTEIISSARAASILLLAKALPPTACPEKYQMRRIRRAPASFAT
jgi:hypothetical protein